MVQDGTVSPNKPVIILTNNNRFMKKYIASLVILLSGLIFGQVTIGKTVNAAAPANLTAVSLEFGNPTGGVKGIVLPWVLSAADVANAVPGTLIFDSTDQKVKFGTSTTAGATSVASWTDLSAGALAPTTANQPDGGTDVPTSKALIGGVPASDGTSGILVLGDTNKAMILPRVNSHADIVNPSAGMMVYVMSTNQLALYNGREWSFWTKP